MGILWGYKTLFFLIKEEHCCMYDMVHSSENCNFWTSIHLPATKGLNPAQQKWCMCVSIIPCFELSECHINKPSCLAMINPQFLFFSLSNSKRSGCTMYAISTFFKFPNLYFRNISLWQKYFENVSFREKQF